MTNPTSPSGIRTLPDFSTRYQRWDDYRKGRDQLDSVAHFQLTELQRTAGQEPADGSGWQQAAEKYRIKEAVLKKIWALSSNHGRRADGTEGPLRPEEQRFLEEATDKIFMRMWITVRSPDEALPWITVSDLPRKPREQVELPRTEAQTLFAAGKQLRQTANDLYQTLERQTPPYRFNRFAGQSICAPVMQALAAEYVLKGRSVRQSGTYRPEHDLFNLYEALSSETKDRIAALGTSRYSLDIPEFLKTHWSDFVDWRYVMEGRLVDSHPPEFDRALAVLIEAFSDDS